MSDTSPDRRLIRIAQAAVVFTPRVPIDRAKNLSGRADQISRMIGAVYQHGAHAIMYGERGAGKTSLAECLLELLREANTSDRRVFAPRVNCDTGDTFDSLWRKVFGKLEVVRRDDPMGFRGAADEQVETVLDDLGEDEVAPEDVRRELYEFGSQSLLVVILDEFDRLRGESITRLVADTIKTLSDANVPCTLLIVGVGDSVTGLIREHESVGRHLVEVPVPRMPAAEQKDIVSSRLPKLGLSITPDALDLFPAMCRGLPFYVHLLGQKAAQSAIQRGATEIDRDAIAAAVGAAVGDSERVLKQAYSDATTSPQKNRLPHTLAACALARTDEFGYFTPKAVCDSLGRVLGQSMKIGDFNKHLPRFISPDHGEVLQRTGQQRNRRFRFRDPLMEPFVLMKSLGDGLISLDHVAGLPADDSR